VNKLTLIVIIIVMFVSMALADGDSTAVSSALYYTSIDSAKSAITDNRNILIDFYSDT